MDQTDIKLVIEAALLAAGRPLPFEKLVEIFTRKGDGPERAEIRAGLEALAADYEERGIELKEVSSGYRIQVRSSMADWLQPLWEERAPRYTRALLETLALIAYRQPITRGEIEEVRGVAVSSNIVRTLMERGWVRVVGHREVPGKPAMLGTTREFLDYFGLRKLEDLPALAEFDEEQPQSSPQGDFIDSFDGDASADADADADGDGDGDAERREGLEAAAGAEPDEASAPGEGEPDGGVATEPQTADDDSAVVAFAGLDAGGSDGGDADEHESAAAEDEPGAEHGPSAGHEPGAEAEHAASEESERQQGPAADEASSFFRALADSLDDGHAASPEDDVTGTSEAPSTEPLETPDEAAHDDPTRDADEAEPAAEQSGSGRI